MKTATQLSRTGLGLVSLTILALVAFVAARNATHSGSAPAEKGEKPAQGAPVRNAYFGDLHVHTVWSNDAYNTGVRTTPDDAYHYAKGEGIRLHNDEMVKLIKPLDFMGVTEHAEYQGIMSRLQDPKSPLYNHPLAKELRSKDSEVRLKAMMAIMATVFSGKPIPEFADKKVGAEIWQEIVKTANKHNQPGKFTAFVAVEWSSNGPKGYQNLHRNIIFRGDKATDLPFTTFDSIKPEDLWTYLENARKQGFEVLAIPHNPNMSEGMMFRPQYSDGQPIDRAYVQRRTQNEPLVEIKQIKGTSETHPVLSPDDEFAGFEIMDYSMNPGGFGSLRSLPKGGYVRDAYRMGLVIEEQLGVNPYKFGVIASGDTHNAAGPYRHDNFFGHIGTEDDTPERRLQGHGQLSNMVKTWGTSGLCGVWAEENTRGAIFDALQRKETFGTSGTRIQVRLFGGWGYEAGDDKRKDFAKVAYDKGVPMGGDLVVRPENAKAPTFLVQTEKDPDAANLDRVQIIKGWAKLGQSFEKIYNVAWSGRREPDLKTGRLPPVGNTVDVPKATYTNTIGSNKLSAVWQDPDFDPTLRAFYYARVLEIPTPRWSAFDAKKLGITAPDPSTLQERAFTSPVWYTPTDAELAKARVQALTVAGLEKEKAKALSTEAIKALLVGKEVRIRNLATGAKYDATYGADGMRTLAATAAWASAHGQGAAKNPYTIKDGKLSSRLDDGSQFSTRLFRHEGRCLAARDDEAGYVNYEVFLR
jgi:hypothetical protein